MLPINEHATALHVCFGICGTFCHIEIMFVRKNKLSPSEMKAIKTTLNIKLLVLIVAAESR